MKYTSQKSHFATYTDGTEGIAYTLSLNNDYDTIVFDQQNNLISDMPITIIPTRMANGDSSYIGEFENVAITPAGDWSGVTFDKSTGKLVISQVPVGFTEATFEIRWNIKEGVVLSKVFSLKKQISTVDYELIVDRSVINSTNIGGRITVTINKKDINGITVIGPNNKNDSASAVTLTGGTFEEDTDNNCWYINYSQGQTGNITITLTENSFIWDMETIEFVSNGQNGESGREEIKRDRYYYITDTNTSPPLYENFKDSNLWGILHPDNIQISSNGLQITVDDKINNTTVFATKAERWPESRLVSFEGWIISENNDDNEDVEKFTMQCDLIPRNSSTNSEEGFPQFSPTLTKEKRRYSYLMELGAKAITNNSKEVTLRLFSDVPQGNNNDVVPNDIYIENLFIQPLTNENGWSKNTHAPLEHGQYLWSFDMVEYSKADEFGNKYSITPIEQQAYLATDGTKGTKTESVRIYYPKGDTGKPSSPSDGDNIGSWWTTDPGVSTTNKYVWSCTGVKTTTYKDAAGTVNSITYNSWTTPELYKAYTSNTNIDPLNYATFLRLSNFKSDQGNFYDDGGNMYINASLMNVGSLLVNDAFSVAINGGQENLALKANDALYNAGDGTKKIDAASYSWELVCTDKGTGIIFPESLFTVGAYYTLKFYIKPIRGTLSHIGGHSICAYPQKFYIDGIEQGGDFDGFTLAETISADNQKELECILVFQFRNGYTDNNLYIQPNRPNYKNDVTCIIRDITLYKGKADPGNIVTKINADAGGVKLQGNKIDFTTSEFVIKDTTNNTLFAAYGRDYTGGNGTTGTVQIAGWEVTKDSIKIKNKDIGAVGSFYLGTQDQYTLDGKTDYRYVGNILSNLWRLTIGSQFGVTSDGGLFATYGKIGGWDMGKNQLTNGTLGDICSFHMYSNNYGVNSTKTIGDHSVEGTVGQTNPGWKLAIGNNFGVTADGKLYCSGGQVAGWNISSDGLFAGGINLKRQGYLRIYGAEDDYGGLEEAEIIKTYDRIDSNKNYFFTVDSKCVAIESVNYESGTAVSGGASINLTTPVPGSGSIINFRTTGPINGYTKNVSFKCKYLKGSKPKFSITSDGLIFAKELAFNRAKITSVSKGIRFGDFTVAGDEGFPAFVGSGHLTVPIDETTDSHYHIDSSVSIVGVTLDYYVDVDDGGTSPAMSNSFSWFEVASAIQEIKSIKAKLGY